MSWSAPSASASSCIARSVQARPSASVKSSSVGVMPEAPLAIRVTVSLVDMQPSESSRSKLTRVAARSARSAVAASTTASVVSTTSIVASWGASIPAPLAIPPMLQPLPSTTTCLLTVSVVMIAVAASSPPSGPSAPRASSTPASSTSRSLVRPIRPVEQTTTSTAPMPSPDGDLLGDGVRGLEALGAGVAVGAAGVQHDRAHDAVLDDLLAPQHRVGLAAVGGEHRRGGERRAVVDDEREVLACRTA